LISASIVAIRLRASSLRSSNVASFKHS
jgi:hypothetical protein